MEFSFKLDTGLFKSLSLFGRKKAQTQLTDPNNELIKQLYDKLGFQLTLMPHEIREYIKQGYLINPHVYTVINKIIKPASAIPHFIYEIKPDKKKEFERYKSYLKEGDLERAELYASKSLQLANVPELQKILEQPNSNQSFQEWSEQGMGFYLLTGEEFIYGLSPAGFKEDMFTSMYNMPSQLTSIEIGDWKQPIKGYKIDYFGLAADIIDPYKVCHIKAFNPYYNGMGSELRGLSPISPLCRVVKRSNDGFEAQMRILQNGHPVGILSNNAERGATKEDAKDLKTQFRRQLQGASNKGDVLVTSLDLKWLSLGLNSVDMQLLDADKADLESIARVYEVPLPIVLNDASSYNNIKEARKAAWMEARIPLLNKRRDALNRWLVPPYKKKTGKDLYIDYDLGAIEALKQDDKVLVDILAVEIQNAMITPNEARYIRNREESKDPNADKLYIGNLKPLDNATPIKTD